MTYEGDRDDPVRLELLGPVLCENDVAHLALSIKPHPSRTNLPTEELILEVHASLSRKGMGRRRSRDDTNRVGGRGGGGGAEEGEESLGEDEMPDDVRSPLKLEAIGGRAALGRGHDSC